MINLENKKGQLSKEDEFTRKEKLMKIQEVLKAPHTPRTSCNLKLQQEIEYKPNNKIQFDEDVLKSKLSELEMVVQENKFNAQ